MTLPRASPWAITFRALGAEKWEFSHSLYRELVPTSDHLRAIGIGRSCTNQTAPIPISRDLVDRLLISKVEHSRKQNDS